jgi:hypothetical protein
MIRKRASMLRYTYVACFVTSSLCNLQNPTCGQFKELRTVFGQLASKFLVHSVSSYRLGHLESPEDHGIQTTVFTAYGGRVCTLEEFIHLHQLRKESKHTPPDSRVLAWRLTESVSDSICSIFIVALSLFIKGVS